VRELLRGFALRREQHLCSSASALLIATAHAGRVPEGTGLSGKLCEVLPHGSAFVR